MTEELTAATVDAVTGDVVIRSPELVKVRKQRGGNIGYLKKIISSSLFVIENSDDDAEITLSSNRDILLEKETLLKNYHERIMNLLEDEEEISTEIEKHNEFIRDIRKCLHSVAKWFDKKRKKYAITSCICLQIREVLPKIALNPFDGDPINFQSFWDMFKSSIHNDTGLDDVTKFNYLKGLLHGKAKAAIAGLGITSSNYKHALEILHERFGDPQLIINTHMDTLLSLRPVSSENVNDLCEIYDIIEIHRRNLSSLDVSMKEYGPILNSIIMSKLTRGIKLNISRQMPAGKWNVIKLMDVFKRERELVARERCECFEHLSIHRDHRPPPTPEDTATLYSGRLQDIACVNKGTHPTIAT